MRYVLVVLFTLLFIHHFTGKSDLALHTDGAAAPGGGAVETAARAEPPQPAIRSKRDLQPLLAGRMPANLIDPAFDIEAAGARLKVITAIDPDLQGFLLDEIDTSHARYIGIVAMEPATGAILAMIDFDKKNPADAVCTESRFPAASVFKIVTAAAAIETKGFRTDRTLAYPGGKYTLYKSQLKKSTKRRCSRVTFRDAFAESVNPVFGKIGLHDLGKETLEGYAEAFYFNHAIDFDLPVSRSRLRVAEEPYNWAEIASGFNRETVISPLHGALIASSILNGGKMMAPYLVRKVLDQEGGVIYRNRITPLNQAIRPATSRVLGRLMQATVASGTCRKQFRGYAKDPALSKLTIGGKTGSIGGDTGDIRYDWFVGFAHENQGGRNLAVAVVVTHDTYIGPRAASYARACMTRYFDDVAAPRRADQDQKKPAEKEI